MEVYFDNSATTRCYESVRDIVIRTMMEDYGNPSSMHLKGIEAEHYVTDAARTIASLLKAQPKEIIYTSGGTESDNLALYGAAEAYKRAGKHIITTRVEHPAVMNPAAFLEKQGFEVTYLPVDSCGVVHPETVAEALREDTILVSVMYVNNETGSVMPVEETARVVHEKSPKAVFHVDAVQAFGKYRIFPAKTGIDLMSVSGHKIHGPKGTGFLYIRDGVRVVPQMLGGGQQNGMRSGTDNVPGIAGLACAAEQIYRDLDASCERMYAIKERLAEGLAGLGGVHINGCALRDAAPHIMSVTFEGIRSEVLLHALEEKGIYISAGSACSSHKRKPSAVLSAMGLPKAHIESTVRISLCEENTLQEADYFLEVINETVPLLRRFTRR
ncbi:MAG: cysteine desulfurase [Blautia sp.]|nr:cysteine desulfurase [Blautia sp.]